MHALLLAISALTAQPIATLVSEANRQLYVPGPRDFASEVYQGPDQNMPIGNRYIISIQPTKKNGQIIIPTSIDEALRELRSALPHWFLNALFQSKGDQMCSVTIVAGDNNFVDYMLPVESWYWSAWRLDRNPSSLMAELNKIGLMDQFSITQALRVGLCLYVKTGNEREGLNAIMTYTPH